MHEYVQQAHLNYYCLKFDVLDHLIHLKDILYHHKKGLYYELTITNVSLRYILGVPIFLETHFNLCATSPRKKNTNQITFKISTEEKLYASYYMWILLDHIHCDFLFPVTFWETKTHCKEYYFFLLLFFVLLVFPSSVFLKVFKKA